MSSKRHVRRSQCGEKVKHISASAAFAAIRALRRDKGEVGLTYYECHVCGCWHVGHRPKHIASYQPGLNAPEKDTDERKPNQ